MSKKSNPIPKTIAGLKTPKTLRRSKTLRSLLRSPVGREIVANALTAGAGAAAAALLRNRDGIERAAANGARRGGRVLSVVSDAISDGASAMMTVVTDAARSAGSEAPAGVAPKPSAAPRRGGRKSKRAVK